MAQIGCPNGSGMDNQDEDVGDCLSVMKFASETSLHPDVVPAIPHLEAMLEAMRTRRRRRAFEAGASALETL